MTYLPFACEPGSRTRHGHGLARVVAAMAACAALAVPAEAVAASGSIGVAAHVRAWTRVETAGAPVVLVVTAADVQRGWVELSEPVVLTVRSNAQRGPAVVVWTSENLVRQGVLTGFSDPVRLGPGQGTIQLPPQKPADQVRYQLHVRLQLATGVTPGEYAFPLRFLAVDGETVSAALR